MGSVYDGASSIQRWAGPVGAKAGVSGGRGGGRSRLPGRAAVTGKPANNRSARRAAAGGGASRAEAQPSADGGKTCVSHQAFAWAFCAGPAVFSGGNECELPGAGFDRRRRCCSRRGNRGGSRSAMGRDVGVAGLSASSARLGARNPLASAAPAGLAAEYERLQRCGEAGHGSDRGLALMTRELAVAHARTLLQPPRRERARTEWTSLGRWFFSAGGGRFRVSTGSHFGISSMRLTAILYTSVQGWSAY